ncbi:IS3 family transposase [Cutibacterium equinum]|uniref:IS3 family transposase n=1 Tax=Cutibacterium equinum TaxID=3016342 RepID=UPI0038CD6FCB
MDELYGSSAFTTVGQLVAELADYPAWLNYHRHHDTNKSLPPVQYRRQVLAAQPYTQTNPTITDRFTPPQDHATRIPTEVQKYAIRIILLQPLPCPVDTLPRNPTQRQR